MASTETKLSLQVDESDVVAALDGYDGLLLRDTAEVGTYWAVMRPKKFPSEAFYVRLAWSSYPDAAPSARFSDGIRGVTNIPRAWPNIPGYRMGSFDICKPFTAEAYEVHPEWRHGPTAWPATGNPFLAVIEQLQDDMNTHYQGRAG